MATDEHALPSPEEIAASKRRLDEFWARVQAVPEQDRVLIDSDKFAGPIGLNDDGTPQTPARGSGRRNSSDPRRTEPGDDD